MKEELYEGYVITPIFIYNGGLKADFQVYNEAKDTAILKPYTTLQRIKDEIDETINN